MFIFKKLLIPRRKKFEANFTEQYELTPEMKKVNYLQLETTCYFAGRRANIKDHHLHFHFERIEKPSRRENMWV